MFGHVSWELRSCGRQGHATYRPDEADLAERLRVAFQAAGVMISGHAIGATVSVGAASSVPPARAANS